MLRKIEQIGRENILLVATFLVTLAVYSKFFFFGHISWDDPEMVFKNTAVRNFDLRTLFTDQFVGNYIPVTMFVHACAWFLFEGNDGGHHAVNILLHLLNGYLVFILGKKLFKDQLLSFFGVIIFLLHPMQVESVGWISELKNILSTTFYLSGLNAYLEYKAGKKKQVFLCFLFFLLGCLSKSSVVIFPLALICLDLIVDEKLDLKDILRKIPFLIVSVVIGLINIQTQTEAQLINYSHEFPVWQRIAFAGFALLKYLMLFLVPAKLSVIYPYPEAKAAVFILGSFFLLLLLALIFYLVRKKNFLWTGVLLFIIANLVLVLQFLPFGEVLFADRYLYVPILALGWLMGAFVSLIRLPVKLAGGIFIVLFAIMTFSRIQVWKSSIVLFEDILKKYPDEFIALNSAGVESMFLNEDRKALEYFDRAIAAAPMNYKGFYNKGLLFLKNGRPQEALQSFNECLQLYQYSKAFTGRASAYYLLNDIPKAINDANTSIKMDPKNPRSYFVLGNCYNDINKMDEAISYYNRAIEFGTEEPDYYFKRAIAHGKKQDFASCLKDLELCLAINPEYYEAYYWRGVAKVNLRQDPCPDLQVAARHNFEPAVIAFNKYCR